MLLIKDGKLFTMSQRSFEKGSVLIKDGKIIEVAENINEDVNMMVINAEGNWVIPGLIDAHCHIGILEEGVGFEGDDLNEAAEPLTPHLRAIDGINPLDTAFEDAIKAGVTTVMSGPGSANVVGGQFAILKTKGVSIDEMVIYETAALKIAFGENPKRIYKGKNKSPITRMGTAALLREALTKARNYINRKEAAGVKGDYFDIDLKMEAFIPVLRREIPLKAHAHRADDILTAIRIAKEFNVLLTIDHCTEGYIIADHIKKSKAPVIYGPTHSTKSKIETKNRDVSTLKLLNEAKIKVAIMTDHPVVPIPLLPQAAGLAVKAGFTIEEALKTITINAAEILGVDDRIGSIEKGKDADIVIYNGNPMENFTETLYTIIDGKIVYKK